MPLRLTGSVSSAGFGTLPLMSKTISGDVPHVTCGSMSSALKRYSFVEYRAFVGNQRAPVFDGFVPCFAFRCERFAFYIVDGGLVDGNHA